MREIPRTTRSGTGFPRYPTQASATILANGDVVVRCATSDMGPGTVHSGRVHP